MESEGDQLSRLFKMLGASHPEGWASSQLNEGIPQLARFLFLRQAWRLIVSEQETSWTDAHACAYEENPKQPYAGVGRALKTLRSKGATTDELTDLVRGMQAELLFSLCYLLEDPGDLEEEVSDITWGLFVVDEDGRPDQPLGGLHESVLSTDPTGREMRPRSVPG